MTSSKKGFALSLVLWIVAALLLGVALLVSFSKDTLIITKGVKEKLEANIEARSTLEQLKFYILTGNYDSIAISNNLTPFPSKIYLDARKQKIGDVTITLSDLSGKINLFYPSPSMVATIASDGKRELFYTMRDSLKDWLDKDNIVNLNGAEQAYYKLQANKAYLPRNAPAIQSVDELWLIKGFENLSNQQKKRLKKNFYAITTGAGINLALLSPLYLSKLLHLNTIELDTLLKLKKEDIEKFKEVVRKNKYYNDEYMGFYPSLKIEINIVVKKENATATFHTIIDFNKGMQVYSYEIL